MNTSKLYLVHLIMSMLPSTRCFAFKRSLLRWAGASIGSGVRVVSSARFLLNGDLSIGDDSWIGHDVLIVGGNSTVTVGARVDIAPRVTLITGSHHQFTVINRAAGTGLSHPITIQDGAWLGACSTILGGTTVGSCSIVAAGAVVTGDTQPYCLFGGVPARKIRDLATGKSY